MSVGIQVFNIHPIGTSQKKVVVRFRLTVLQPSKTHDFLVPWAHHTGIDMLTFLIFRVMMGSSEGCNFFYRLRGYATGLTDQKYYVWSWLIFWNFEISIWRSFFISRWSRAVPRRCENCCCDGTFKEKTRAHHTGIDMLTFLIFELWWEFRRGVTFFTGCAGMRRDLPTKSTMFDLD